MTIKHNNGTTFIEGIFLPFADNPNGNGRIYDYDCIDDSVVSDYLKQIKDHKAYGECEVFRRLEEKEISLANVSHKINKIEKTQEGIFGEIEILNTTKGKSAKILIKNHENEGFNTDLNVRPRLIGNVYDDGTITIDQIISFDIIYGFEDPFDPIHYKNKRYKLSKKKDKGI